ncbi:Hsp33 family molecular chaperone HslO [Paracoccus sp. p4-l81]|uniref:Hsp33 family molecular chaperone HslO n=1 Tax=unclassified Paracoccus (in: a-proteobacteria) TaxID=2688777 RepID=UPI0035B7D0E7
MTDTTLTWDDTVLPFQLDRSDIRGRVARLDGVLGRILTQHSYPPAVEALVAEVALLTALIGQTVKLRWKLSIQVQGNGAVRTIATDYFAPAEEGAPARIRGWANFDADRLDPTRSAFDQIGQGYLAILIDQGPGSVPYQGIVPLEGASLAACAENYFAQSEQLPTRFSLAFGRSRLPGADERWRAGGIMIQHMPKASPLAATAPVAQAEDAPGENWARAQILLDTVEEIELIGPQVTPQTLLLRLFHEEAPRVFPAQAVTFGCTCSPAKVRQSLSIYSAKDIATMTTAEGTVTADCQFCGAHYVFDPATLGMDAALPEDADG